MQTVRLKLMEESRPEIPIKGDLDHGNVPLRMWPTSPRMRSTGSVSYDAPEKPEIRYSIVHGGWRSYAGKTEIVPEVRHGASADLGPHVSTGLN